MKVISKQLLNELNVQDSYAGKITHLITIQMHYTLMTHSQKVCLKALPHMCCSLM